MKCTSPIFLTVLLVCAVLACTNDSGHPGALAGSGGIPASGGAGGTTGLGSQAGSGGGAGVSSRPEEASGSGGTQAGDASDGGGMLVDSAAQVAHTLSGPVDDAVQAAGRTAVLLWEVSSGSPDYLYKFGEGTVANGRFSIVLPGDPLDEAINSFGIGVAIVVVLPAGITLADGRLAIKAFNADTMAGVSARYSVIWRAQTLDFPSPPPANFWPLSFPVGYACGACTLKPDGGSFEGFAPTSCDQIHITTYSQGTMCNWT